MAERTIASNPAHTSAIVVDAAAAVAADGICDELQDWLRASDRRPQIDR